MIENEIEFTIKNLNREKILKEIVKITEIKNIKIEQNNIKFSVNKKYSKKINKILNKKSARLENTRHKGFLNYLKNTIFRVGIIIPIIIFFIFILISNNFIFKYEIIGIENIQKIEIQQVLNQNNIDGIINKGSINTKTIEQEILKIDKVSLVSVIIKGNTLVINIKEKIYNSEYEEKDNFKPLVSLYNGTITHLEIVQGTPLVKIGQTVKVGQELVAPYVIDTSGNRLSIKPMAQIKADIFYTTINQENENKIQYKDTGKTFVKKEMSLFGNNIFSSSQDCGFKFYRTETFTEFVGKQNGLPICYTLTKYFEQEQIIINNYFSLNKEQVLYECAQKTRQLVNNYDIIKDEYYHIQETAGIFTITYTIIASGSLI